MSKQLAKFAPRPLAQLLEGVDFTEGGAAKRLPTDDASSLFTRLCEAGLHTDALKVAAAALPKREAVWMAARCAREVVGAGAPPDQLAALDAATAWSKDPSDSNRRAASAASEKAGLDQAFGCVALAAFLSEGSLGPPEVPAIPPAAHLCAVACGLALEIALASIPRPGQAQAGARCIAIVREVAEQPAPWDPTPAASTTSAPISAAASKPAAPARPKR